MGAGFECHVCITRAAAGPLLTAETGKAVGLGSAAA